MIIRYLYFFIKFSVVAGMFQNIFKLYKIYNYFMADNKVSMPSSGGGLVRYFDDYKSKREFSPKFVIAFIIFIILFEIYVHNFY